MKRLLLLCLLLSSLGLSTVAHAQGKPRIQVVYPREGQQIAAVDSEFVVGQALGARELLINGVSTKLFDSGAFLGWIPVKAGEFTISLRARNAAGETALERHVNILAPPLETPRDSLRIEVDRRQPYQDQWLWSGDLLEVYCRTSPRAEVFFSIPGLVRDVKMIELPAQRKWSFPGNAFRNATIPDSLYLHGIYYGAYRIGPGERVDSARVIYHARSRVALYTREDRTGLYASDSIRYSIDSSFADLFSTDSSEGRVTILDDRFPYAVQIKDSAIVTRVGPGLGYFWPFVGKGTRLELTGRKGPWMRMRAAPHQEIWAHDTSLIMLPHGFPIPRGTVNYTRIEGFEKHTEVRLFLDQKLPFRVAESLDPLELVVTVYGVTSDIDWIKYDFADPLVAYADWRQPEPGVLEYIVRLNADQLWGYDAYYDENTLVLSIKKPPTGGLGLRGLRVVVDPGHSADNGSVGPTGIKEKDANLWISRKLEDALERRGAIVTLTRAGNEDVPLYDRPKTAKLAAADLYISVHNNALPDGVNPWENHGASTYYYHPASKKLAECMQTSLLGRLEMPDFGLYRANFAVIRPTQYPAILVECAFMIIPEHEAALKTGSFQTQVADAIAQGVEAFVEKSLPDKKYQAAVAEVQRRSR